jgi:hypothetical protein
LSADWQKNALVVGPLTLIGIIDYRRPETAPPRRPTAHKVLAVVEPQSTVTLTIPDSARNLASLVYNPRKFNAHRVRDGDAAITLVSCDQPNGDKPWERGTQFNGAFVVFGRRCVPVDIAVGGEPAVRRLLSFGAGTCRSRSAG